jgi:hypothetical protein
MTNTTLSNGSVVLNGSPYNATGNVTSTNISLGNMNRWGMFYANHSLPTNTNISYAIMASNGSTLCTMPSLSRSPDPGPSDGIARASSRPRRAPGRGDSAFRIPRAL